MDWLRNQKFTIVLATFGFLLVIAGFFKVSDITKLAITPLPSPLYPVLILGTALLIISIFLYIDDKQRSGVELPKDLNNRRKLDKKSIYMSAPMSSFVIAGHPEQYKDSRKEILSIIKAIKHECGIDNIYYAGESIEDVGNFDLPDASLKDDFGNIQAREYFVLFWPEKFISRSSLVEAGIALTLNKKCIYLVKKPEDLPFLLQGAQNVTRNIKIIKYADIADLLNIIQINRDKIFDFTKIG